MGGDAPPTPYTSLRRTKRQIYVTVNLHLSLYFNTHNSPEGLGETWGGGTNIPPVFCTMTNKCTRN